MKRITDTLVDIADIVTKDYLSTSQKMVLFFAYIRIVVKRFFDGRSFNFLNTNRQKFLSFDVEVENYNDFYYTFREVFIKDDYYFETDKTEPFIVDCGGNIGLSVLYFKYLYPKSHILVFEALPENFKILKNNIETNSLENIELIEKAVGGEVGELEIFGDKRAATINKSMAEENDAKNEENRSVISVDLLSNYIEGTVDFLKMDIEGAESSVLEDLGETNKLKLVRWLTMEYHAMAEPENSLAKILSNLEACGFRTTFFATSARPTKISKRDFTHIMLTSRQKKDANKNEK